MMILLPFNLQLWDEMATNMTYAKLFPKMLQDFVSRIDMSMFTLPGNIQVQVAVPAGTGNNTAVIFSATQAHPLNNAMKAAQEGILAIGGSAVEADKIRASVV